MATETTPQPSPRPGARIAYLDGMRGLAALYVVLYHSYFMEVTVSKLHASYSLWQRFTLHWLGFGEEAMAVFLVLSGYSLMLPVLETRGRIEEGIGRFLLRRARRLLVPYYVILLLQLVLIATVPKMDRINVDLFQRSFPQADNFSSGVLLSHFFLFDNLKHAWKFSIDPPAWGVATMWWLYVLFALVLVPLWRIVGGVVLAGFALAVALAAHFYFQGAGDAASPWFVGIFVLGMVAAAQTRAFALVPEKKGPPAAWLLVAGALFAASAYIGLMHEQWMWDRIFAMDILVGAAAACFVIYCAERVQKKGALPFPFSMLESRLLTSLGRISYELFLIHFPVLWLLHAHVTASIATTAFARLRVLMALGVPASIILAWIFHRLFHPRYAVPVSVRKRGGVSEANAG